MPGKPSPEVAHLRAKIAAETSWSRTVDRSARTRPAREASLKRFEQQVDPDGTLPPAVRAQRAEHAKRAYFAKLALLSAHARRRNKTADGAA
ncbi:hypothetical protein [Fodinicola feengrottensis]|uniref:Uncharacterized protein n=1 Tax=Fodinicola feengrottensis TaxID=435914 RepID=A0ABN2IKE3_9ACTN|nr:hypothetical protein [Fodinicola feengrottensis]